MKNKFLFLALLTANALYAQEERKFAATSAHPGPFASIGITDNPIVVNGFDVIYKDDVVKEYFGWGFNKETGKMEYMKEVVEKDTVRQAFDNDKKHRWLSMDPVLKANESPYAGFANNPVLFVDPDGREIHLNFATAEAKAAYESVVNMGLEGVYNVSLQKINAGDVYKVVIVAAKEGNNVSMLSEQGKAFYDIMQNVVDAPEIVEMDVVYNNELVKTGSFQLNAIDMADVEQFNKTGPDIETYGATQIGKVAHETQEQLIKEKLGLKKGEATRGAFSLSHDLNEGDNMLSGIEAENKVNLNERTDKWRDYDADKSISIHKERDGSKTKVSVRYPIGEGTAKVKQRNK